MTGVQTCALPISVAPHFSFISASQFLRIYAFIPMSPIRGTPTLSHLRPRKSPKLHSSFTNLNHQSPEKPTYCTCFTTPHSQSQPPNNQQVDFFRFHPPSPLFHSPSLPPQILLTICKIFLQLPNSRCFLRTKLMKVQNRLL